MQCKNYTFFSKKKKKNVNVFAIFQDRNFNITFANNFVKFWTTGSRLSFVNPCSAWFREEQSAHEPGHSISYKMCAQRRLRSACASAESIHSLRRALCGRPNIQSVSRRTAKMISLRIRAGWSVFADRTCPLAGNVVPRLKHKQRRFRYSELVRTFVGRWETSGLLKSELRTDQPERIRRLVIVTI